MAVFPDQTGPLNLEMKERIYADFAGGKSAESIAKRYCRTKTTVYRVINEMRAKMVMELPLDYMDSDGSPVQASSSIRTGTASSAAAGGVGARRSET